MDTQSDFLVELVNSVGNVDFETTYQTELPRIYNFFRYRLGDDQVAEDLTAETFEKAWKHRERYREDQASFSTWLFIIARRIAADHFRRLTFAAALCTALIAALAFSPSARRPQWLDCRDRRDDLFRVRGVCSSNSAPRIPGDPRPRRDPAAC